MKRNLIISVQKPDFAKIDSGVEGSFQGASSQAIQKIFAPGARYQDHVLYLHRDSTIREPEKALVNERVKDGSFIYITGHGCETAGNVLGNYQSTQIVASVNFFATALCGSNQLNVGDSINVVLWVCNAGEEGQASTAAQLVEAFYRRGINATIFANTDYMDRFNGVYTYTETHHNCMRFRHSAEAHNTVRVFRVHKGILIEQQMPSNIYFGVNGLQIEPGKDVKIDAYFNKKSLPTISRRNVTQPKKILTEASSIVAVEAPFDLASMMINKAGEKDLAVFTDRFIEFVKQHDCGFPDSTQSHLRYIACLIYYEILPVAAIIVHTDNADGRLLDGNYREFVSNALVRSCLYSDEKKQPTEIAKNTSVIKKLLNNLNIVSSDSVSYKAIEYSLFPILCRIDTAIYQRREYIQELVNAHNKTALQQRLLSQLALQCCPNTTGKMPDKGVLIRQCNLIVNCDFTRLESELLQPLTDLLNQLESNYQPGLHVSTDNDKSKMQQLQQRYLQDLIEACHHCIHENISNLQDTKTLANALFEKLKPQLIALVQKTQSEIAELETIPAQEKTKTRIGIKKKKSPHPKSRAISSKVNMALIDLIQHLEDTKKQQPSSKK